MLAAYIYVIRTGFVRKQLEWWQWAEGTMQLCLYTAVVDTVYRLQRWAARANLRAGDLMKAREYNGSSWSGSGRMSWPARDVTAQFFRYDSSMSTHAFVTASWHALGVLPGACWQQAMLTNLGHACLYQRVWHDPPWGQPDEHSARCNSNNVLSVLHISDRKLQPTVLHISDRKLQPTSQTSALMLRAAKHMLTAGHKRVSWPTVAPAHLRDHQMCSVVQEGIQVCPSEDGAHDIADR